MEIQSFMIWTFTCLISHEFVNSANILAVFPLEVKSHSFFFEVLWKSLTDAGHHITYVSPYRPSKSIENCTFIDSRLSKHESSSPFAKYDFKSMSWFQYFALITDLTENYCYDIAKLKEMQDIMNAKEKKFDVIFIGMYIMYQCYLPIAKKLEIPVIGALSIRSFLFSDYDMGNPRNPAVVPFEFASVPEKMTFYERMKNILYQIHFDIFIYFVANSKLDKFFSEYYTWFDWREDTKVSLTFFNSHHSILPRPLAPNYIEIAGIQISPTSKPLPKNIENFIENATHGVILFTLGSMTKSEFLNTETRQMFRDAFAEIPQRVIWKFEEEIHNLSANVMKLDWVPQRDILAHKNVKGFITHCGISGMQEAIYEGKPIIMMPLFIDQPANAARITERGAGIHLDIHTLTKEKLLNAIYTITNDTRYYDRMQQLSRVFKDRPISPEESVVYWTEYVIRHKGASHLRSAAIDMPLYQYFLIDVFLFSVAAFLIPLFLVYFVTKKCCSCILRIRNKFKCIRKQKPKNC